MIINRKWAMPNKNTFQIPPIKRLIEKYITTSEVWIDPYSNNSPFAHLCTTNDLNMGVASDFHLESIEFLRLYQDQSVDGVLFDPPYSPRQISECYKQVGREVHMKDTQSSFYGDRKREVARVLRPGGLALCFGWNSGGVGLTNGMELVEILIVPHGGAHNDTICTVEVKR